MPPVGVLTPTYEQAGWKEVTGTVIVPTPSAPSGTDGTASASIWVGIDGSGSTACGGQIFQTGFDIKVDNGTVSYVGEKGIFLSSVLVAYDAHFVSLARVVP